MHFRVFLSAQCFMALSSHCGIVTFSAARTGKTHFFPFLIRNVVNGSCVLVCFWQKRRRPEADEPLSKTNHQRTAARSSQTTQTNKHIHQLIHRNFSNAAWSWNNALTSRTVFPENVAILFSNFYTSTEYFATPSMPNRILIVNFPYYYHFEQWIN